MLKELIKIANELDNRKLLKEADAVDYILIKIAGGRADLFGDLFGGLVRSGDEILDMERASARYSDAAESAPTPRRTADTEDTSSMPARPGDDTAYIDDVIEPGRAAGMAKADIIRAATDDMFIGGSTGARSFLDHIQEAYKRLGQDMNPAQQRAFLEEQIRTSPHVGGAAKADPNSVIKALAGEASTITRVPLGGPVTRLEIKDIISRPPLGEGGDGMFWAIPNSDLGIKISKTLIPNIDEYLNKNTFEAASDISGQLVGRIGPSDTRGIWILKKQEGIPAGAPFRRGREILEGDAAAFREKLLIQASMPQSAYDDLAEQLVDFNDRGIRIDPSKPNNVLIDAPGSKYNFVDLAPVQHGVTGDTTRWNTGYEIVALLLDPQQFKNLKLYKDPEAVAAARDIGKKIKAAVSNNPRLPQQIDPASGGLPRPIEYEWVFKNPERSIAEIAEQEAVAARARAALGDTDPDGVW
tara:strand:+ start:374 stop:1783 length:1410 start_codon:yes stop_codon:yes gene_type:complete